MKTNVSNSMGYDIFRSQRFSEIPSAEPLKSFMAKRDSLKHLRSTLHEGVEH